MLMRRKVGRLGGWGTGWRGTLRTWLQLRWSLPASSVPPRLFSFSNLSSSRIRTHSTPSVHPTVSTSPTPAEAMPVGVVLLLLFGVLSPLLSSPINRQVGISQDVFITLANDTYGQEHRVCSIDSQTYGDGETIPTSSPCEHCICRPPGFACTIISCEYRAGCKAIKRSNQCCPEYQCECEKDGKIYGNGEKIVDGTNPCEICYCQGGEILCAVIDCYWRSDCQPRYVQDRCCPLYDHCPPPHHSQGPFAQRISTTSLPPTSTPAPFPWANLSSAVFNEIDQERPMVVVATRRPQVAVLGSSEVEEEKKEIFSAPHYLPQAPPKTEESSSPPLLQEKVSEEKEGVQDEAVPASEEIPPQEVTTAAPSHDNIEEPTTQTVHRDEAPLAAAPDDVVPSTDAPSTEGPSVGIANDESSGTQATVGDDEVGEVTDGPVAQDEAASITEAPESVVHDEIIGTTEESTKVLKDFVASTEPAVALDEVVTTEETFNVIQDEPPVATDRPTELIADEPVTTESSPSFVQDEVVPTTEESYVNFHDGKPEDDVEAATTEIPIRNSHDEVAGTEVPLSGVDDEVEPTEVPSHHEEQLMTEAPAHYDNDEVVPTTQVPSGVSQDEPSGDTERPSILHDDAEVIPTTASPAEPSQSHDDADVVNAAENMVNVSSEDIIPPEEGVAELPEIHSQVFSADADTIELSAPVKVNEESPTSVPLTSADEPAGTTPADFLGEDEDEETRHPDDQHAQDPEEPTEEPPTADVGLLGDTNRFRLDLSSNEISSEEGKKPLGDVFQDATTARVFKDELTSGEGTTEVPQLNDESVGTTEEIQHDEVSTLPPSSADSRLRTGLGGSEEGGETSTANVLRDETDVGGPTEAPSRLRTALLDEELELNELEATALPTEESFGSLNDENIEASTSSRLNDDIPTTFAPSRLRSELFDSVESEEKTTVSPNRLRSGLLSIEQESVEVSTVREDNRVNDDETVSFDAAGETTVAPSRLRSGLVSSEEVSNEGTTSSPSRLRTALGQSEEEEAKTTEASTANDEPAELTTASSSPLRAGLLEEEGVAEAGSTLPPNRLRSALSQELFSSEDEPLQTTSSSGGLEDEAPSALPDSSPTSALPQEPPSRLRTSGEEDSASTASPLVYQDFVEVTSTAPIQEEFISYTSQQNLRSDESQTTDPSILHDEAPSSNTELPLETQSDSEFDASTASYATHDDVEDEEPLETTSVPAADRRVFEMPSRLPPVDPAMPRLREDVSVVGGDEEIHSDDGLSSSSQDSWFAATYNKLRALAGLFPKKDASPKSAGGRSPRRHL